MNQQSVSSIIVEVFDALCNYGPVILGLHTIYLLWDISTSFYYYILGQFANCILNVALKLFFQQAKPGEDEIKYDLALSRRGKRLLFRDGLPHGVFGMPAENSQVDLFSVVFIWLTFRNTTMLYLNTAAAAIIMIHGVVERKNTILQEFVGAIVGGALAVFVFQMTAKQLKGQIREKKDDDAPPNVDFL